MRGGNLKWTNIRLAVLVFLVSLTLSVSSWSMLLLSLLRFLFCVFVAVAAFV